MMEPELPVSSPRSPSIFADKFLWGMIVILCFVGWGVHRYTEFQRAKDWRDRVRLLVEEERDRGYQLEAKVNKNYIFDVICGRTLKQLARANGDAGKESGALLSFSSHFNNPLEPGRDNVQLWYLREDDELLDWKSTGVIKDKNLVRELLRWLKDGSGKAHPNPSRRGMYNFLLGEKFDYPAFRLYPGKVQQIEFKKQGIYALRFDRVARENQETGAAPSSAKGSILLSVVHWQHFNEVLLGRISAELESQKGNEFQIHFFSLKEGHDKITHPEIPDHIGRFIEKNRENLLRLKGPVHFTEAGELWTFFPMESRTSQWSIPRNTNFFMFHREIARFENFFLLRRPLEKFQRENFYFYLAYEGVLLVVAGGIFFLVLYLRRAVFIGVKFKLILFLFLCVGLPALIWLFNQVRAIRESRPAKFLEIKEQTQRLLTQTIHDADSDRINMLFLCRTLRDEFHLEEGSGGGEFGDIRGRLERNPIFNSVFVYDNQASRTFNYSRTREGRDNQVFDAIVRNICYYLARDFNPRVDESGMSAGALLASFFDKQIFRILNKLNDFVDLKFGTQALTTYIDDIYDATGKLKNVFLGVISEDEYLKAILSGYARQSMGDEGGSTRILLQVETGVSIPEIPETWKRAFQERGLEKFSGHLRDDFDADYLLTLRYIDRFNLLFIGAEPKGPILRRISEQQKFLTAGLFSALFILLLVVLVLVAGVLTPLGKLREAMVAVNDANYQFHLEIDSRDEIGDLGRIFNKMIQGMAEREEFAARNTLLALQDKKSQTELGNARDIQRMLFPDTMPVVEGYEFFGRSQSIDAVGGDYYDFLPLAGGRFAIVIGDVSGHGVPAAILMAMAKSGTLLGLSHPLTPGKLLESLNQLVFKTMRRKRMMTFFIAQLDPKSHQMIFSNAGHNYPVIHTRSGEKRYLGASSYPLGTRKRGEFQEVSYALEGGDVICFYTDGIVEALNPEGQPFGYERLQSLVAAHHQLGARELVEKLFTEQHEFSRGRAPDDDVTLAVVKRLNNSGRG